jgi:predicted nucleotidyltransferase
MSSKRNPSAPYVQPYRYPSPNIPLAAIRRFARQIAERFHPDKIILFGSYAYGTPHAESDVDLLVIMPARNAIDQAIRIDLAFDWPFALDVHVRTPYQIRHGLKEDDRDWFLYEVMTKGKVLYEAPYGSVGEQGRRGRRRRKVVGRPRSPWSPGVVNSESSLSVGSMNQPQPSGLVRQQGAGGRFWRPKRYCQ